MKQKQEMLDEIYSIEVSYHEKKFHVDREELQLWAHSNFWCIGFLGPSISPRIVGGKDAKDDEAPYQCSLQNKSKHFCGCAIFDPNSDRDRSSRNSRWIISAAHCLLGYFINFDLNTK